MGSPGPANSSHLITTGYQFGREFSCIGRDNSELRRFANLGKHHLMSVPGWLAARLWPGDMEACGIIGHAGSMTSGIGCLGSSNGYGGDWRNTAIIGGPWESDVSLATGFFKIADIAVERWQAGRRKRRDRDPDHLQLRAWHRTGPEGGDPRGRRVPARRWRCGSRHPDRQDWRVDVGDPFDRAVGRPVDEIARPAPTRAGSAAPAETLDVLGKLHVLDEHGQAFRYSAVKTGLRGARVLERVRPSEQRFDIVAVAEAAFWTTTPPTKPRCGTL